MDKKKHFAEVIESSLTGWVSQSWQWDTFPVFGSLLAIEEKKRTIFGIVHQIQTGSMDPMRYPFAYQKTQEELLKEQPQIFEFLKTTFSCVTVGYQEKGILYYVLSPKPPKIHSFVATPPKELCKNFFASTTYLHLLFSHSAHIFNLDELMLALLKQYETLTILSKEKFEAFMHTYSLLTGNDYRRFKLFLQRAEHMIISNPELIQSTSR